jgi:hypothetical protein
MMPLLRNALFKIGIRLMSATLKKRPKKTLRKHWRILLSDTAAAQHIS